MDDKLISDLSWNGIAEKKLGMTPELERLLNEWFNKDIRRNMMENYDGQ